MTPECNRRTYLAIVGGAGVGTVVSTPVGAIQECEADDELVAEFEAAREQLAALERERDRLSQELSTLPGEIEQAEAQLVEDRARYPTSVREQARDVGLSIRDSVVFIDMFDEATGLSGTATGWFVEPNYVMTNAHNVEDLTPTTSRQGWLPDGTAFEWELLASAGGGGPDIAVLETDYTGTPLSVGSTVGLSAGDRLIQVGNPGGAGSWVVSLGEVKSTSGGDLTTDVPGLSGVSGSPLVDMSGDVVGVTYGADAEGSPSGSGPTPSPAEVHHQLFAPVGDSLHVPIEDAVALLEGWT